MLNAATRSATAANTTSTVSNKAMNELSTSARCSAVSCAPVIAVAPAGRAGCNCRTSADCETPGSAATSTPVMSSRPPSRSCCASAVVNAAKVVPAMLSDVPNVAMPTTVILTGWGTSTVVELPTCRSPVWADARSMTTSPAPAGARPSTIFHGLSRAAVTQFEPRVGGPLPPMRSPFAPTICTRPSTSGAVAATPSTAAT